MMESHGCMQAMKKASFFQFILPKAQEQYYIGAAEEEEEDVKPIIVGGGKIQEASRSSGRAVKVPRFEVEIRGNLKLQHLFPWEIKKTLTKGDVGGNGSEGLRLSAEQVQNHILRHWNKREEEYEERFNAGAMLEPVVIRDLDTNTVHSLVLCKWDAFHMYTIQNSWSEEFVMRRRLFQGTLIGMYWDIRRFCLCFSVLEFPYS